MNLLNRFHAFLSRFRGKNSQSTPMAVIRDQMFEKRELPMGMMAFEEWSDRIISGACIPGATAQSQKFSLAHMVTTTDDDFECDAFFIKKLRKTAINQVCAAKMEEIRNEVKARLAATAEVPQVQEATKLSVVSNAPGTAAPNDGSGGKLKK